MKKFGFTLAEVLIVLGIIGTVSALTLPAVVMQQKSSQIGAKLGRVRQVLIAANEQYLLDEELDSLTPIKDSNYLPNIVKKIKGANYYNSTLYLPIGASVTKQANSSTSAGECYLKDGSFGGTVACIKVDLSNGALSANGTPIGVIGRDIFYFLIDKTGAVVPYGSQKLGAPGTPTSNNYAMCDANNSKKTTKNNMGCAGVIFDNNLKIPESYTIPKT